MNVYKLINKINIKSYKINDEITKLDKECEKFNQLKITLPEDMDGPLAKYAGRLALLGGCHIELETLEMVGKLSVYQRNDRRKFIKDKLLDRYVYINRWLFDEEDEIVVRGSIRRKKKVTKYDMMNV